MDAGELTRNERRAAWALGIVVALSRWPAISRSLWDWDEALFALAVHDYDVTAHHPHPPGFPLFLGLAKLLHALTPLDAFHALQCIAVVSSLFVFPAMLLVARQLKFSPFVSLASALLLSFFPNVWFFGGTAFSDVPSLVLVLLAIGLLLRGRTSDRALLAGAVVLGLAAGFRPQNLLIGFVPMLLALRARRRTALAGIAMMTAIVGISYFAAAQASGGWDPYRAALERHEQYIRATDSFLSGVRPGLIQVADDFFLRPYRAPAINVAITLLAFGGFLRLRRNAILPLLTFGPFLLFAWLYLDFHSASRFSIGYMPLYAVLAANGIPERGRAITLAAFVGSMIAWMTPALLVVHTTTSPPVAAIEDVRARFDRGAHVLYVDERLAAHAALLLPEYERVPVRVAPPLAADPRALLLREGASIAPGARSFTREREPLAGVARRRYFEVSVIEKRRPLSSP